MCVPVEVVQGQGLQVVKQVPAQGIGAPLGHPYHHIALEEVAGGGKEVDQKEFSHIDRQARQGDLTGRHGRRNVIDNGPHHVGGGHAGQGRGDDAEYADDQHNRMLSHIAQQALQASGTRQWGRFRGRCVFSGWWL